MEMFLYHATDESKMIAIQQEGLLKKYAGGVYLAPTAEDAAKFMVLRFDVENVAIIRVDVSKLDESLLKESYDHSEAFFKCRAFVYNGDIPPNNFIVSDRLSRIVGGI